MKRALRVVGRGLGLASRALGSAGRIMVALVGVIGISAALANYTMTQGSGTTFGSIVVSTVHYAQMLNCDFVTPSQCANVKAPSTAAAAADESLVTNESPNSQISTTTGTTADGPYNGTGSASIVSVLKGIFAAAGQSITISGSITNPTSVLTLPATTSAYTAGQLIANSATAGSVVNPSFAIATSGGGAAISRLRLDTNDNTSTAWGAQTVQVDLWTTTPTWTNGDRGTWSPATGTGAHLGSFVCVFSAEFGDGAFSECSVSTGNFAAVQLQSGTSVFWSLKAISGSGVTGASKAFTLTAELMN